MPFDDLLNGAIDTVAGAPSPASSGTTLTVSNASRWPDPATAGFYPASIWPAADFYTNNDSERVMVVAKSGSTLTIVRAQEETTGRTVVVGDQIAISIGGRDLQGLTAPQRNVLHNSGFSLFQRTPPGTATARTDDTYGPDRWNILTQTAAVNVERSVGSLSYWAVKLTQSQAVAQRMGLEQLIEHREGYPLRFVPLRLSFYAKCSTTTVLRFAILEWTGTVDAITSDVVLSWTSGTYTAANFFLAASVGVVAVGSLSVATNYTLCQLRGTPTAGGNLIVFVWTEAAAAQNVTVEISDIQFGIDSLHQAWQAKPMAEEVANCQRYYEKSFPLDTAPAQNVTANEGISSFAQPAGASAGQHLGHVTFQTLKRAAPTVTLYNPDAANAQFRNIDGASDWSSSVVESASARSFALQGTSAAGSAAGQRAAVQWSADCEL